MLENDFGCLEIKQKRLVRLLQRGTSPCVHPRCCPALAEMRQLEQQPTGTRCIPMALTFPEAGKQGRLLFQAAAGIYGGGRNVP